MQQLIAFDERLAASIYNLIANQSNLSNLAIGIGVGFVYLAPVILLIVWFVISRKIALRAALAGLLAWFGLSKLVASLVDRIRPAESLIGVKELIFHRPDNSFPSDHSAFLMALTASFYLARQPKLASWLLGLTIMVGIARVGIGVHYPGDILAGCTIGLVAAYLIKAIEQPLDRSLIEPLVNQAKKLRL